MSMGLNPWSADSFIPSEDEQVRNSIVIIGIQRNIPGLYQKKAELGYQSLCLGFFAVFFVLETVIRGRVPWPIP